MKLHNSTFSYLKPTVDQIASMNQAREAARIYANILQELLPDGPDKTYIIRQHRATAMWVNVCLTRHADGAPREEQPNAGPGAEPSGGPGAVLDSRIGHD